MNQKEWTHRKVSFTERKSEEIITYHKLERTGCFCITFLWPTTSLALDLNRTNY